MVMKYALINGKILNGHQDMEVETGKAIFTRTHQHACSSCRKWKTTKETKR